MPADRIRQIEAYARSMMADGEVAHDFKHVDRVRRWALHIAQQEGYPHLDRVEAAALLHDIGLVDGRERHAETGAQMASEFLQTHRLFSPEASQEVTQAVRFHTSLEEKGMLAAIVRDADILEVLGPVGLMRAFTSKSGIPEYPDGNVRSDTWGMTAEQFTQRFAQGVGIGETIADQINFQISCFQNLTTASARALGQPLVAQMIAFMQDLEAQINPDL